MVNDHCPSHKEHNQYMWLSIMHRFTSKKKIPYKKHYQETQKLLLQTLIDSTQQEKLEIPKSNTEKKGF